MKRILVAILMPILLALGALGGVAQAQTSMVTIGDGTTTTNRFPFNTYNTYAYTQMVYEQSEVGEGGYIGAITFQNASTSTTTFNEMTIWMGHTSVSTFSDNSWVPQDALTQVYHTTDFVINQETGDLTIVLDAPFLYDGVQNLAICVGHTSSRYNTSVKFRYTMKSPSTCITRGSDNDESYALHPGTESGTLKNERPNITLVKNSTPVFCFPVSGLTVTGLTDGEIDVAWNAVAGTPTYEVAILDTLLEGSNLDVCSPTTVFGPNYSFTDLSPNTVYLVGVRVLCEGNSYSGWREMLVRTSPIALTLPYVCDFETASARDAWVLENGTMRNRWVMDVYATEDYDMYISNNAETHAYAYDFSDAKGNVFAMCLLNFDEAGEYNVGYDWKCMGEHRQDYLRAMLVPATMINELKAGTMIHSDFTSMTLPAGMISIDDNHKLNLSNEINHYANVVDIPTAGNYYLTFLWSNDNRDGANPPAMVDNITVMKTTCHGADSVVVDNITTTEARLTVHGGTTPNYQLCYRAMGAAHYDTLTISSPYTMTGLMAGTSYECVLRTICDDGISYGASEFMFTTECAVMDLPWVFDAEAPFVRHDTGSEEFPYCWENINGQSSSYYWRKTNGTGDYHGGSQAIQFNGTSWGSSYDEWLITPQFNFVHGAEMTVWLKVEATWGTSTGRFAIYASNDMATSATDTAHFDMLQIEAVNATNNSALNNNHVVFTNSQWVQYKITLPATLMGTHYLAFVVKDVQCSSFEMDDIYMYTPSSCATPTNIHFVEMGATTGRLTWESEASSFKVYYGEPGMDMATADFVTTTTNSVDVTGLNPNTEYEYILVATCSDGENSTPTAPSRFHTACEPLPNTAFPFIEDFSDNSAGINEVLDPCWGKGTNNSVNYPHVVTSKYNYTPNSLYFCSENMYYSYAALPAFEESVNNLVLSCSIYREPASSYEHKESKIVVGLMSNPYDYSTFTAFDTLAPQEADAWNDFQITLADFGVEAGRYIAFAMPAGREDEAHLDNVKVDLNGDCAFPTDLSVETISYSDASITWNDNTASSWIVYYGLPGFDADTVSAPVMTTDRVAYIPNLTPQTVYEAMVKASCGNGNYSTESLRIRFETACAPVTLLPYIEDFENYASGSSNQINPCWVKSVVGECSTDYPYPAASAKINGNRGLFFKAYHSSSSHYNSYVALPLFEEDVRNLRISFNMKNSLSTSYSTVASSIVAVGVMENPHDLSTFDTVAVVDMSNVPTGSVQLHEILLDSYMGEGQYIALVAKSVDRGNMNYADNTFYLDDINVNTIPTCERPTEFVATMDKTTADLSWNGNASNYELIYSQNYDMSDAVSTIVSGTNIQLTELTPHTCYYINVRGICDATDTSEWMMAPVKACTLMDCGEGYQNIVDTIGNGSNTSYLYTLNCNSYAEEAHTWSIYTKEELEAMGLFSNSSMIHSVMMHVGDAGDPVTFKMYMAEKSIAEFSESMTDTVPVSEMTLVYDGTMDFVAESWNEIILNSPFEYRDSANLVIACVRDLGLDRSTKFYYTMGDAYRSAYSYMSLSGYSSEDVSSSRSDMVFNICAEVPSCIRPMDVVANNISDVSAEISWTGLSDSYQVVYTTLDVNPDEIELTTANSVLENATQVILQNLTPNTTYNIYVRGFCDSDTSMWSLPIQIVTPCGAFGIPFTENFDSYRASRDEYTMNTCWVMGSNGTGTTGVYPNINDEYASTAPNCMEFNSTETAYSYAALPLFDRPVTDLMMTFKLHKMTAEFGTIYVGVMDDPENVSTFTRVATVQPVHTETWEEFEVSLGEYGGTGSYIAFMVPDSIHSFVRLDDLEIFETPDCMSPVDVAVVENTITVTTAEIGWNDRNEGSASSYEIEYGPKGFELGTGISVTTNANPYTLTGLTPSTCYDVYVKVNCSAESSSRWSIVESFCTECAPMALPVTYDFDDEMAGKTAPLPLCFNRYNDAQDPTYEHLPFINQIAVYAHSGNQYLYFSIGDGDGQPNNEAMIFPAIDTATYPMNNTQMIFWGRRGNNDSPISVGVMSDPTDISTFVAVDTVILGQTYTEYMISFADYQGEGTYPALLAYSNTMPVTAYIDDVTIEPMSTCPRVASLSASHVTSSAATIDWVDVSDATSWQVSYSAEGATEVNYVIANSKPYTLTGLTEMTQYTFNVRPICGVGDTASWATLAGGFKTLMSVATIPYSNGFEDAIESSKWQTCAGVPSVDWYRGTAVAGAEGSYSLYVSSDNGASCSTDWQWNYNATAYRDFDFGPTPSTFTLTFKAKVGGTSDYEDLFDTDYYEGLFVMNVDPSADVVASEDVRTSPWGDPDTMDAKMLHLRNSTAWQTYTIMMDNVSGVRRIGFFWCNYFTEMMGGTVSDISCVIDSVVITEMTCPRPNSLVANNIDINTADISWNGNASQYEVAYRSTHGSVYNYQICQSNTIALTNLNSNTEYEVKVRSLCSAADTSIWSETLIFTTNCAPYVATDTISENFDAIVGVGYRAEGEMPGCWDAYSDATNGVVPHVVGTGSYWYSRTGNSLVMTTGSSYGNPVVKLPTTVEPVNTLAMTYWMCTESDHNGLLQIGYFVGSDLATDFVAIDSIQASAASKHTINYGVQSAGTGCFDTVVFSNVPDNAVAVGFRWSNDGSSYFSVCIDDVKLYVAGAVATCDAPTALEANNITTTSADLTWQGSANAYEFEYRMNGVADWTSQSVYANDYSLIGLQPSTLYEWRVRANCGEMYSDWATNTFVTLDSVPVATCDAPTNLVATNITTTSVDLSWQGTASAYEVEYRINGMADWIAQTINTNSYSLSGLQSSTLYEWRVRANCETLNSDWTLSTFTTLDSVPVVTCDAPTNLAVNNITDSSADLSWQGTANAYEVEYRANGVADWTSQTINANSYNLNGLQAETDYDWRVRTVCDDLVSDWAMAQFTTIAESATCEVPTDVVATINGNSVTIDWNATAGQVQWEVSLLSDNSDEIIEIVNAHPATINGLQGATSYTAKVRAICGTDFYSDWSETVGFTTTACNEISNLMVSDITTTSAKIAWTAGADELEWEVEYGLQDFELGQGNNITVDATEYLIENLNEATTYDVYVRALCGEAFYSQWSEKLQFTTESTPEGIDGVDGEFNCTIYPNPTSHATTISLNGIEGKVQITVVDMNGRTMANETMECAGNCEKRLDVEHLSQGTYFVRILGDDINSVRKLIVR